MKPISKIGIGPMSSDIIEAVFRYSENNNIPLMLIASKSQIDWDGGYVNNWTTKEYSEYINELKKQYPKARVYICRDHCGPGFKKYDIDDVYKTIDSDIENGFDFIHIDFCHFKGSHVEMLEESRRAIEYIRNKDKNILIEVGTDENTGAQFNDAEIDRIEQDMKFFTNLAPVHFFVVQTGSLIREINQIGKFNGDFIKKIRSVADRYQLNLKEHNADYIGSDEIQKRTGLIDAMNIAPQYGVIQTKLTLQKCLNYGIDPSDFIDEAYESKKWKKWLHKNTEDNKFLCSVVAGHYVFSSDAYKNLYEKINKHENFKETIIQEMMKNFEMYLNNLK